MEYGIICPGGMLIILPGGSLVKNSHLFPAFAESLNNESQPLSGCVTKLCSCPVTVSVSPVFNVCVENCSFSILTNLLCSCAWTPCALADPSTSETEDRTITVARAVTINVLLCIISLYLAIPE
jgi:hypothetical protein